MAPALPEWAGGPCSVRTVKEAISARGGRQLDFPAAGKETENKMKYSVVIPALNEEQNVPIVAEQVAAALNALGDPWELVFIDDGSTDGTYQAMEACRVKDPRVKIIRFQRNFGQSAAWRAGFDHAAGEIVISMDADLQNDAQDIPRMVRMLEKENYDVVSGWRSPRKDARHLRFLSAVGNWLRRFMTGDPTHDHGCSLKVYRRKCLEGLDFHRDLHRRYITAILRWEGYRVGETRVRHHRRRYGRSKYSIRKKWNGILDLLVVAFWARHAAQPVRAAGAIYAVDHLAGFPEKTPS
jgi:glycosyltransferase involved in cell wall biosynthesis